MIKQFLTLSSGPDRKTDAMNTSEVDNWSCLIGDGHKKTDARVGAGEDSEFGRVAVDSATSIIIPPLLLADTLLQLAFPFQCKALGKC